MSTQITRLNNNTLAVAGVLDFVNVVALKTEGEQLLSQMSEACVIDLSKVTRAGSAGVSLLLGWLRFANNRDLPLSFSHLPEDLLGVAQVSGLQDILQDTSLI